MKNTKIIAIVTFLIIFALPSKFYGQSDANQKAKEGANFICDCTKKSLDKNGINTSKLAEIYNSYQLKGSLLSKYNADVKKINNQMNLKYSLVEADIYLCRDKFRQQYSNYLKNKTFLDKMQTIINTNPFTNGSKLIKNLASNL
ncbi:hypothetical protein EKL98_14940 [Flavobacterium bomense]|uniref:Uncharacterized protein n=1 Tax=Flavobacterium bomense TaxID=2497483 RepID=A0A432CF88_9FLAO|nr:hypothetical protein [Flavobacterium bomense]RTZ01434.1 hypothetical protein EKL98_14940 [Flavobacterium bomense]